MVLVNMIIAERVNELADLQAAHVCDQMRQQCIRADVEGDAEKRIGGALIQLAMKHARVSTFFDFELKERVTRREIDVVTLAWVPAADDQSTRIRIRFDFLD